MSFSLHHQQHKSAGSFSRRRRSHGKVVEGMPASSASQDLMRRERGRTRQEKGRKGRKRQSKEYCDWIPRDHGWMARKREKEAAGELRGPELPEEFFSSTGILKSLPRIFLMLPGVIFSSQTLIPPSSLILLLSFSRRDSHRRIFLSFSMIPFHLNKRP